MNTLKICHITAYIHNVISQLLLFINFRIIKSWLLTAVALVLLSFVNQAQLNKHTFLAGGYGNFSGTKFLSQPLSQEISESDFTEIHLLPSAGYFTTDKFAIGARTNFSIWKNKRISGETNNNYRTIKFDYGPFIRYYFLEKDKLCNLLADVSYQFGRVTYSTERRNRSIFSAMAGPAIFFNSSIGLELLVGYLLETEQSSTTSPGNLFKMTDKGLQLSIGFQVHFEKH